MRTIVGALSIMMAAGMIADFDVFESDSEVYVQVWSTDGRDDDRLQKHIVAVLPMHVDARHVTVVSTSVS